MTHVYSKMRLVTRILCLKNLASRRLVILLNLSLLYIETLQLESASKSFIPWIERPIAILSGFSHDYGDRPEARAGESI